MSLAAARRFVEAAAGPAAERARILAFLDAHPDALHRSCVDGHLTASALVVDAAVDHAVLLHHRKLDRWLQPGGHADGDSDLARVALREAAEETGIDGLVLARPHAVDLDVHVVAPPGEPEHLHLDVRFLVQAPTGAVAHPNHESHALRWCPLHELLDSDEPGMRRLAAAAVLLRTGAYHRDVSFPARRMRRLRRTPALRRMVAETRLSPDDFVAPLFVREGIDEPHPIASLPGVVQHTRDTLIKEAHRLADLGIPALILFGVPARKDAEGSGAWDPDGIVQLALRDLRDEMGDRMVLMADLCLDEYTDHGHCGLVDDHGEVDNDATLELYARAALAQAEAGADICAPSGMMDGQVAAIRAALDSEGHDQVAILAYAAKYASALYGPFRDAVDVTIAGGGDRKGYQQDYRNAREGLAEVLLDVAEGADMVMVKPALAYLDVIAAARAAVDVPVAAYHVSGEYSMIKAAAERGWIDGTAVAMEHLTAIKRAGADVILTYLAAEIAELLS